jgi:opacity protein-like surface antigen
LALAPALHPVCLDARRADSLALATRRWQMDYRWLRTTIACVVSCCLWTTVASAQQQNWNFELAGGVTPTTGNVSSRLTTGWNVDLAGGYDFQNGLGLNVDFLYSGLGVANSVLNTLNVPSADAHMWAISVGPKWRFPILGNVNAYVVGGVGFYRRTVEFLQPTVGVIDVIDPWWGYIGPVAVPADQVLGSITRNAWGVNGGAGISIPLGHSGTEAFAEFRYHYADMKPTSTSVVPVSFGLRVSGLGLKTP